MILQGFTCSSAVMLPGIITRLKKKSQSVDISGPGCNPVAAEAQTPQPSKPLPATQAAPSEEEQDNTTNTQRHNPRRSDLKRYYTIDAGQKKTPDKKDGRRMSFQKPRGTLEYSDSDGVQQKESAVSPAHACARPSRVVSSTSEEEEAFTEKFLKINCKYITNGKGTVNGVLLVTPNNIMFDPHKMDPLVQENGCEEYGIMCPMEEVMSAALYKEIVDSKIKESLSIDDRTVFVKL